MVIYIVYDGDRAKKCATIIYDFICDLKFEDRTKIVTINSASKFQQKLITSRRDDEKIIIVGYGELTHKCLKNLDLNFDEYGMKYAFTDDGLAVLYASRSGLGYDGTGKKAFINHYNEQMKKTDNKSLAKKYGIPLTFGNRGSTRESQFDLLALTFAIEDCTSSFLGLPYSECYHKKNTVYISPDNIPNFFDLFNGMNDEDEDEEDEDNHEIVIDLSPKVIIDLQKSPDMEFLRKKLGYSIYMTDMWQINKDVKEIPESELLPGEISGVLCVVGCYLVRKAYRVYTFENEETIPLSDDSKFKKVKKGWNSHDYEALDDYYTCEEVSVKHISELAKSLSEFHIVFQNYVNLHGFDNFEISTIATLKDHAGDDDSTAKLLIRHYFIGNSRSSYEWEIYSPDGTETTLEEDDFQPF
jgi:hypothetical protein